MLTRFHQRQSIATDGRLASLPRRQAEGHNRRLLPGVATTVILRRLTSSFRSEIWDCRNLGCQVSVLTQSPRSRWPWVSHRAPPGLRLLFAVGSFARLTRTFRLWRWRQYSTSKCL
jgi:hypothetical protein